MNKFFLFGLIGWLWSYSTACSQGQTYAVIVGIADYKAMTYRTGDLRFADRDARQVAAFLQSRQGGNVPASHLRLLTNTQATRVAIVRAMTVFARATPSDHVILYFSGHGLADSFVPYDVMPGQPASLLTHNAVKKAFRRSKAQAKLCIADACLSGSMTHKASPTTQSMAGAFTSGTTVAMLLAGRATQFAVEDRRVSGGIFTFFLLQGLRGLADQDKNRTVTIRELHTYVSPRVRRATSGRQSPVFYGNFPDTLVLSHL